MAVVGVDGCEGGWCAVRLENERFDVRVFKDVQELWDEWSDVDLVLIDMPIGLPYRGHPDRACDFEARKLLGPLRGTSVFPTPGRASFGGQTRPEASCLNKTEIGKRIGVQTWGILPKIREVDQFLRRNDSARRKVREVHPELCFWVFSDGQAIVKNKKTPEGKRVRLDLLRRLDSRADAIRDHALAKYRRTKVAEDDVHDALVAAITATYRPDRLVSIPVTPEYDAHGLRMKMVYARVG